MLTLVMLREHVLRPSALGRTLLLLAFAGAVIIGLLAMHTISSGSGHSNPHHSPMTVESDAPAAADAASGDGCDGLCAPTHDMVTMACVLALLATTTLFVGALGRDRTRSRPQVEMLDVSQTGRRLSPRSLPPPDLNVLSISRT